jgi:hypothetical protein
MSRGITGSAEIAYGPDPLGIAGLPLDAALNRAGIKRHAMYGRGYRVCDGIVHRIKTANEIEDEINARSVTYGPCFRCGGRVCGCGRRG